jgi:nucleoside-diphosphate-sugar epimerase
MEWQTMKILVTGATGFLGGALARRLHKEGHTVLATGRNLKKGAELTKLGISFEPAELSDAAHMEQLCIEKDWIFHCAAFSSVWGARDTFWRCNVQGTQNLVTGALRQGVKRFIHISSPSIYFRFSDIENIGEDDPLPPKFINSYTASKYAAEEEIAVGVQNGLPAIILRPRAIYGPGDTAIFPRIVRALEKGTLPIIGGGKNKTDVSYIDNVVESCLCAAKADVPLEGRAYNITDGEPILLWPMLTHICKELGFSIPTKKRSARILRWAARGLEVIHRRFTPEKEPILTEYSVGLLSCTCTLNIDRARTELGYTPLVSTEEGINRFLSWWKEQS